jgi:hypothetical protein
MLAASRVEGIPGWTFEERRDPSFRYLDEPHHYLLKGRRLWHPSAVFEESGYVDKTYYTDEHRYRGAYVHRARHLLDMGTWSIDQCAPQFRPYLDAYLEAKHVWKLKPRLSEVPIYHPLMNYGVTPDTESLILGGEAGIVEFKTGGLPWWTCIQTAAQDLGMKPWDTEPIYRLRIGIQLRADGTFRAKEYTDMEDYNTWIGLLIGQQRRGEPDHTLSPLDE